MSEAIPPPRPPEPPAPPPVPPRPWYVRHMGLILVLSVAANLFFGGLFIGRMLNPYGHPPPPPAPSAMLEGPGGVFEGLGGDARDRVFRRMEDHSGELRARFRDLRAARQAVGEAMVADPFDRAALEASFTALRAASEDTQAALHGLLVEAAEEMPAEERSLLLRRLSPRGRRGGDDDRP